ncbi:MAG: hypothetical protein QXW17_03485 [Candidatus Bathyarchaeia archaeon]|nr:hypothetical protein [Candidatus Bathyarchaeota archaeon]
MRRTMLLAVLGLAALSAVIISAYSVLAWYGGYTRITRWVERGSMPFSAEPPRISDAQNFTWTFRRGWRWALGNKYCRGFEIELSEGFRKKVLEIVSSDTDVQKFLDEGYDVSDIKVTHMKFTVQENGQITMESDRVMLMLTKGEGSRAFVEIDLKAEKVTKITIVNITVIDKSTST